MNHNRLFPLLALAATLPLAGCVGTGPNTQQGAVAGGALGALAGAIIGNNSHAGTGQGALIGAAIGAVAGGTLGNAEDHRQGTIYTSREAAQTKIVYEEPPPAPAPREEVVVVQPAPEYVWIAGYWEYTGRREYVWVPGHWAQPPPRCHRYVAAHWERRHGGYIYVRGYWHS